MIKNIIFDVGNVLIDFRWRELMADLGFTDQMIEEMKTKMVLSSDWAGLDRGSWDEDDAPAHFSDIMPEYKNEIKLFWDNIMDVVSEFDYAAPMIRSLRAVGYKVFLLSNYPPKLFRMHCSRFSFVGDTDGMVISGDVHLVKPDAAIYELLLERYGLRADECIFIDDLPHNVEGAKAVGMQGIVFKSYESAVEELHKNQISF